MVIRRRDRLWKLLATSFVKLGYFMKKDNFWNAKLAPDVPSSGNHAVSYLNYAFLWLVMGHYEHIPATDENTDEDGMLLRMLFVKTCGLITKRLRTVLVDYVHLAVTFRSKCAVQKVMYVSSPILDSTRIYYVQERSE